MCHSKIIPEAKQRIELSSRDPAGFLFLKDGLHYRAVSSAYLGHLQHTYESGLYTSLTENGHLLPFSKIENNLEIFGHPVVLLPEQLAFVSYPFEWSFSQLKEAALATLDIQRIALEHGATLKDATPYNIQFHRGRMCLIDSLSLEKYSEGTPWKAYRQFCETFLAPLLWASRMGSEILPVQSAFLEGIPLHLASRLLPGSSWFNLATLLHVHLHAKASLYSESKKLRESTLTVSKKSVTALVRGLRSGIQSLSPKWGKSEWSDYYSSCNYSQQAFELKKTIIEGWLDRIEPQTAWDLGANTGEFSLLLSKRGASVISVDMDHLCVDRLYQKVRAEKDSGIQPLRGNLVNPSPALGWLNQERPSLLQRGGKRDVVLALALVHHLCLGKNISSGELGKLFRQIGKWIIVEFVPRNDPQSLRLLRTREDIFSHYSEREFIAEWQKDFVLEGTKAVGDTGRVLHLLRGHE